jgi:hypothetical protein
MAVIRSKQYDQNVENIIEHPIIMAMAEEIRIVRNEVLDSPNFMMNAYHEAVKRGLTDFGHIGAPAEAITKILR